MYADADQRATGIRARVSHMDEVIMGEYAGWRSCEERESTWAWRMKLTRRVSDGREHRVRAGTRSCSKESHVTIRARSCGDNGEKRGVRGEGEEKKGQ